jgi:hypothetical protein
LDDALEGGGYSRGEWRGVLVPTAAVVAVLIISVVAWYLVTDPGPDVQRLEDIDEEGSFKLLGHCWGNSTAYGSHVHAINLTLEEGDTVTLSYTSNGPPDGIQVRLQHPLHPTDGQGGTGGSRVYSSSSGGNGTVGLFVEESGAYQLYFWHPGSILAPGPGDDPDAHITATVGYILEVTRGSRP